MDMTRFLRTLLSITVLFLALSPPAHAYLDPGSGSFMIQVLIAGMAAFLLTLKSFWNNIIHFFSDKKGGREPKDKG